jgi:hypothetical protein
VSRDAGHKGERDGKRRDDVESHDEYPEKKFGRCGLREREEAQPYNDKSK